MVVEGRRGTCWTMGGNTDNDGCDGTGRDSACTADDGSIRETNSTDNDKDDKNDNNIYIKNQNRF